MGGRELAMIDVDLFADEGGAPWSAFVVCQAARPWRAALVLEDDARRAAPFSPTRARLPGC